MAKTIMIDPTVLIGKSRLPKRSDATLEVSPDSNAYLVFSGYGSKTKCPPGNKIAIFPTQKRAWSPRWTGEIVSKTWSVETQLGYPYVVGRFVIDSLKWIDPRDRLIKISSEIQEEYIGDAIKLLRSLFKGRDPTKKRSKG